MKKINKTQKEQVIKHSQLQQLNLEQLESIAGGPVPEDPAKTHGG